MRPCLCEPFASTFTGVRRLVAGDTWRVDSQVSRLESALEFVPGFSKLPTAISMASEIAAARSNEYDVVVIGGGPAGSTAASLLSQRGRRVLLLEKESFPRHHVGESLLPGTIEVHEAAWSA